MVLYQTDFQKWSSKFTSLLNGNCVEVAQHPKPNKEEEWSDFIKTLNNSISTWCNSDDLGIRTTDSFHMVHRHNVYLILCGSIYYAIAKSIKGNSY